MPEGKRIVAYIPEPLFDRLRKHIQTDGDMEEAEKKTRLNEFLIKAITGRLDRVPR